jgi:hypothetical protein
VTQESASDFPAEQVPPFKAIELAVSAEAHGGGSLAFAAGGDLSINYRLPKVATDLVGDNETEFVLSTCFLAPSGYLSVETTIDNPQNGAVIVVGHRGTGRRTTALRALLHAGTVRRVYELFPDWQLTISRSDLPLAHNSRYLLDLSDIDANEADRLLEGLRDYGKALSNMGSLIAITMLPALASRHETALRPLITRPICRPAERIVFAHLASGAISDSRTGWLKEPPLVELLEEMNRAGVGPADAAHLAQRIRETSRDGLQDLVDETHHWRSRFKKYFDRNEPESARRRSLLIATAALDGLRVRTILDAEQMLLNRLGITVAPHESITGPGISARLEEFEASVKDNRADLSLGRREFAKSVIMYVWQEYPELRKPMLAWLGSLSDIGDEEVSQASIRLVNALAQQADGRMVVQNLFDLARSQKSPHRKYAFAALDELLIDPTIGWYAQRRLYEIATGKSAGKFSGMAQLCQGRMALRQLPKALVRLRAFAERTDRPAWPPISQALRTIASIPSLRSEVVAALLDWTASDRSHTAGIYGVLDLLDPRLDASLVVALVEDAKSDPGLTLLLQRMWYVVFNDPDGASIGSPILQRWCELAESERLDMATVASILNSVIKIPLDGGWQGFFVSSITVAMRAYIFNRHWQSTVTDAGATQTDI